jgi:hypothetical protein
VTKYACRLQGVCNNLVFELMNSSCHNYNVSQRAEANNKKTI